VFFEGAGKREKNDVEDEENLVWDVILPSGA
jgi:hypothetical protein